MFEQKENTLQKNGTKESNKHEKNLGSQSGEIITSDGKNTRDETRKNG